MALNAREVKNVGKVYPPMDPGTNPGRLVQVIDLGLQPQEYKGEAKAPKNEMMLTYEFLDEFLPDDDGEPDLKKPRWLSEQIPLHSLEAEKAKSTQRYYALDPNEDEEGDFIALVGRPCMITVVQNKGRDGKVYNNIANVSAMRAKDAAKAAPLVNPPKVFEIDKPDTTIFLSLPDWVQKKIKESLNYEGSALEKALAEIKGEKKPKAKEAVKTDKPVDDYIPYNGLGQDGEASLAEAIAGDEW